MAIFAGNWIYSGYLVMLMIDPNRYRVTIWAKKHSAGEYTEHVKTLWSKDRDKLMKRTEKYILKYNR